MARLAFVPLIFVWLLAIALPSNALGQISTMPSGYLDAFPEPAAVVARIQGSDPIDRAARQDAALRVLFRIHDDLNIARRAEENRSGRRPSESIQAEEKFLEQYRAFDRDALRPVGLTAAEQQAFRNRVTDLSTIDREFKREVLEEFFSPEWRRGYSATMAVLRAPAETVEPEQDVAIEELGPRRGRRQARSDASARLVGEVFDFAWFFLLLYLVVTALAPRISRMLVLMFRRRTRPCANCGNVLSVDALKCPQCGQATARAAGKTKLKACRRCGEKLEVAAHRVAWREYDSFTSPTSVHTTTSGSSTSTTVTGGGTTTISRHAVRHTPCTRCGEPRPLLRLVDINWIGNHVVPMFFFLLFLTVTALAMFRANIGGAEFWWLHIFIFVWWLVRVQHWLFD